MKYPQMSVNLSRKNRNLPEVIEEHSIELDLSKPDTIGHIFHEYNRLRGLELANTC